MVYLNKEQKSEPYIFKEVNLLNSEQQYHRNRMVVQGVQLKIWRHKSKNLRDRRQTSCAVTFSDCATSAPSSGGIWNCRSQPAKVISQLFYSFSATKPNTSDAIMESSKMCKLTIWQYDNMTRWQDDRMPIWQDNNMTGWHGVIVAWWQDNGYCNFYLLNIFWKKSPISGWWRRWRNQFKVVLIQSD